MIIVLKRMPSSCAYQDLRGHLDVVRCLSRLVELRVDRAGSDRFERASLRFLAGRRRPSLPLAVAFSVSAERDSSSLRLAGTSGVT
jgi:hypothetical protein